MSKTEIKYPHYLAILSILVIPISGLAIDIYAPSLPTVAQYFNTDKSLTQLTITSYMVGLGLMQLFAGGISDSFGRRIPFIFGSSIFALTTLCTPLAQNIYQLIGLRFLQGVAVALTIVPMRSVIPDLFEGKNLYKWMNYMVMAWSIGPIIAPAIGGHLQHYFGWKSNFYFLGFYTLLSGLLIYFFLPETSKHRHAFHLGEIFKRYKTILSNPNYILSLLTNGFLYSTLIVFTVVGPFLIQSVMHYSAITFGYMALSVGLFWFLGTMSNRFLMQIPFQLKTKICLWVMFIIGIMNLVIIQFVPLNIYNLVIPLLFIGWFGGIIFPDHFAYGISLFPKTSGSANALFGAFIFLITSITSGLATYLKSTHLTPLSLSIAGLIAFCLMFAYVRR